MYVYVGTFVVAAVVLSTTLGFYTPLSDHPRVLVVLEVLVNLSLILEVALRATVLGKAYLQSWYNILDVAMACLSGGFLFFEAPIDSRHGHRESTREDMELSQSLVMLRIIVQFARLLLIAEHAQRSRKSLQAADDVVMGSPFDDLNLDFALLRERDMQAKHCGEYDGF